MARGEGRGVCAAGLDRPSNEAPGQFQRNLRAAVLFRSDVVARSAWIERHIGTGEHAVLVDVTGGYSVISVMGPKAEALLRRLSSDDLSKAGMPFATTQEIDVGHARARAARMSYVGGPGYELYVTADQCLTLYDALVAAGGEVGLRDAGYYTIDALRIEAGRRAWCAELSPDETPW